MSVDPGHPLTPHVDPQGLSEMLGAHSGGHIQKHLAWVCQSRGDVFTLVTRVNAIICIPRDDDEILKNSKSSFS